MIVGQFATLGANLISRWQRQLIDSGHPRRPHGHPLGLRWNERRLLLEFGLTRRRIDEQRRLGREWTDSDVLDGRRDRRLGGGFDRGIDAAGCGISRTGGSWFEPLEPLGTLLFSAQAWSDIGQPRVVQAGKD